MRDEVYKEYNKAEDIRKAVLNGNYPQMPQFCPEDYTNLIKACWTKDPLKRPPFTFIANKLKSMIQDANSIFTNNEIMHSSIDDEL